METNSKLGRDEKLKSRKQTERLFSEGKKFMIGTLKVFYDLYPGEKTGIQFGTGAGKRMFKKAVERNRIKRVIRETYRLQKNPLLELVSAQQKQLNLFFLYTGKELPDYNEVFEMTGKVIKKLCRIVTESA